MHRLVVEAAINGVAYDSFVEALRAAPQPSFVFLDPSRWHVHHINGDHLDNRPENLEVVTVSEHHRRHQDVSKVLRKVEPDDVVTIERVGKRMTYDLVMADEPHNFIANGVVVHNSGKTTGTIAALARLGLNAIVVVSDGGLHRQWVRRLRVELGLREDEIGFIGAGKFKLAPITIAMQQTLWRLSDKCWARVNAYFGVLVVDEVQRAAARTFVTAVSRSAARYRFGISADETRKDRKEFLTYDLFGEVVADVSERELVDAGIVHDVEVLVVPTKFEAPWYNAQRAAFGEGSDKPPPDFNKLLDKVVADEERNQLAMMFALSEAKNGAQVVVFSQRREHAARFCAIAAQHGVKSGTLLGQDEAEFERTVDALKLGDLRFAAGTLQAAGTGLDIPSVSVGVVVTPFATNRQGFKQLRGRICRRHDGKSKAVIYYLWDSAIYGLSSVRNLVKWNGRVKVLTDDGRGWVEASKFLKQSKGARGGRDDEEERSDEGGDDLFASAGNVRR